MSKIYKVTYPFRIESFWAKTISPSPSSAARLDLMFLIVFNELQNDCQLPLRNNFPWLKKFNMTRNLSK